MNMEPKGKSGEEKKKWRTSVIVTVLVVFLVIVVGVVFFAKKNGLLLSDRERVLWAVSNTLTETEEVEEFLSDMVDISQSTEYTMSLETEEDGNHTLMELGNAQDGKQLHLETELGGIFDKEITAFIDETQISMIHSDVKNTVLVYNYTRENSGYLFQKILPKEQVEGLNKALTSIHEAGGEAKSSRAKVEVETIAKAYSRFVFEKADERSFEINDESVLCQGYKMVLDEDIAGVIAMEKGSEVTFFIDDRLLAAVVIKTEEKKVEIRFSGGAYRLQNIAIYEEDEAVLALEIQSLKSTNSNVELEGKALINWDSMEELDTTETLQLFRYINTDSSLTNRWSDIRICLNEGVDLEKLEGTTLDVGNASLLELGKTMMELLVKYIGEWL